MYKNGRSALQNNGLKFFLKILKYQCYNLIWSNLVEYLERS